MTMIKVCPVCGSEFSSNVNAKRYCSLTCRRRVERQHAQLRKQQQVKVSQEKKSNAYDWHNFNIAPSQYLQEPEIHWYDDTPNRQAIRARYGNHTFSIPDSLKGCTDVDKLLDWIFGEN